MSYPQESFVHYELERGSLIEQRREAVSSNTLLYQLEVLKKTGRYDAFKLKWHSCYSDAPDVWPIPNHLFWDSDVAKWIEGACYLLREQRHSKVEVAVQELVDMIRAAQHADGYLNIHFTVVEPDKRFTNIRDFHELYNAGHLIEAALAHHDLYQNTQLLEPILKYVHLLCQTFGPEEHQIHGYPGHPEIELALLRLYVRTGSQKILDLAHHFISQRGNPKGANGKHFFVAEAEARGEDPNCRPAYWPSHDCLWYYQAHAPILEQNTIEGHSVRAMYLLTAVADLARLTPSPDEAFLKATRRLWRNMVDKKMYLTGGIGAMKQWEGFGIDFFLPQGTDDGGCYSETCAAIGVMMLAERLLQIKLDGEVGDILELCLYNSVLTSMSSDGKAFTYVNQLASSNQDLSKREDWFTCACCPPNVLRLLGQIGGYATTHRADPTANSAHISVHLFIPGTLRFSVGETPVELSQTSNYPWSGDIAFRLKTSIRNSSISIRIPKWASSWQISPKAPGAEVIDGYLHLQSSYLSANPNFTLTLPLIPRLVSPHPHTNQAILALSRGPIIYCVEDHDNTWVTDHFKSVQLDQNCNISENSVSDKTTGDRYVSLTVTKGASVRDDANLEANPAADAETVRGRRDNARPIEKLRFVPYYFRANRGGQGMMRVGLSDSRSNPA